MLNELDGRLKAILQQPVGDVRQEQQQQRQLGVVEGQLVGKELVDALQGLRLYVNAFFMQAMRGSSGQGGLGEDGRGGSSTAG